MRFMALIAIVLLGCNNHIGQATDKLNQLVTINSSSGSDATANVQVVEDAITNFDDRISSGDTLVEFSAPWCSVCKKQKPMVAMLMDRHPNLKLIEVNVDDNVALTARFQVAFVPAFRFLRNGFLVGSTGYSTTDELEHLIQIGML